MSKIIDTALATHVINEVDANRQVTPLEEFKANARYPYTYAYDFVRSHYEKFGFHEMPSRGDVAHCMGVDKERVVVSLALAYYRHIHNS